MLHRTPIILRACRTHQRWEVLMLLLLAMAMSARMALSHGHQMPADEATIRGLQQGSGYYYSPPQEGENYYEEYNDDESNGSSSSSYTALSSEGKLWFALLVFTIVTLDCSVIMLLNAAIWRPRWEARIAQFVVDSSSSSSNNDGDDNNINSVHLVQGLCRLVEPVKKSVLLGCVTVDDRSIGNTRTNTNNHKLKQIVEYKFLMRYKHDGQTIEKFMKLKSPLHDAIVPKANRTAELYVLSSDPTISLLKRHVHSELERFDYEGLKHKELYRSFGLLGGKQGYIWSILLFILGCIGPALPLQMLSKDIRFDSNVWSRIVIVLVANIIVLATTNSNINNRNEGYPNEFYKYIGQERKSLVREAQLARRRQRQQERRQRRNNQILGEDGVISDSENTRTSSNNSSLTQSYTSDSRLHRHQVRLMMSGTVSRGRVRSSSIGGSSVASSISTLMDIKEEEDEEELEGVEVIASDSFPKREQLEP